jgi:hypothetical protein
MVSAVGFGSIVSFVAWSRPVEEIRSFLRQADFGWVLGDPPEEEEEEENGKANNED